jgi:two-component sensor histidine kinase/DNA-binding NarL/FixJ family response regulator
MLKVMIAEDDFFMADLLGEYLGDHGYEVCGIAGTVAEAVELGERYKPDLAVLDMRLAAGGRGTDVAAQLKRTGGPGILYASGNARSMEPNGLTKTDGEALLGKPFRPEDLVSALKIVEEIVRTGKASRPFPEGFRLLEPSDRTNSDTDNAAAEVQRLLRQQAALARFGNFALGEGDLGKVLTEAARVCAEGLGVSFCKVCRYRADENDLLVEAGVGWHRGVVGRVVSRADDSSPQGRAFITEAPVICSDLSKDASFVLPAFYAEHGIISTVDVIIKKQDGQPYGVLEIDSPVQHDYDRHDIDFLTGFANVLAEAVNSSKRNAVLQSAVDRMKDLVGDKDRLLAAQSVILDEKSLLLDEKAVMAQELQHRVRNNLQLVYGMLHKQLESSTDGPDKDGINSIARRVLTLAKVYDHLLGTGLSRTIDFGGYLWSLCSTFEALESQRKRIKLTCQCEALVLDLDSVTTLGLVVAELVSNSYLHGFPDRAGVISVSLIPDKSCDQATLIVADDGVGFRATGKSKRHGMALVKRLMQQIHGTAELRSDHGTVWTLRFPVTNQQSHGQTGSSSGAKQQPVAC